MILTTNKVGDYLVVAIEGRLDTSTAGDFEKSMMELLEGGNTKIILDCSDLQYISSSGLRVSLIIQKKMIPRSGRFKICSLQPSIREIFDLSGFSMIFTIYPDLQTALEA
ncbi:MAG: STAS domain-containing protein [Bacteroidota bacterium]